MFNLCGKDVNVFSSEELPSFPSLTNLNRFFIAKDGIIFSNKKNIIYKQEEGGVSNLLKLKSQSFATIQTLTLDKNWIWLGLSNGLWGIKNGVSLLNTGSQNKHDLQQKLVL